MRHVLPAVLLSLAILAIGGHGNELVAAEPPDFQPAPDFLKLPEGWTWGKCSAVGINTKGEIFALHRGEHPVVVFDASGKYLRSWGDNLLVIPHGLRIDRDDNVWTTDIGGHRVHKFDPQGKLLLSLGTGKPGDGDDQFNKPSDVAFGSNGEFFVSDGYVNTRVMKYAANGKLLKMWGKPGKGPGEFNLPHSIILDSQGRVLVADRENNRVQIFDQEGQFLAEWPGMAPYGLAFDKGGTLFVADAFHNEILSLDSAGKIQKRWGQKGSGPGEFNLPHMLTFDASGNLLVAEVDGKRFQKLVRK